MDNTWSTSNILIKVHNIIGKVILKIKRDQYLKEMIKAYSTLERIMFYHFLWLLELMSEVKWRSFKGQNMWDINQI